MVSSSTAVEIFQDGEMVCFLGDSITHDGLFYRFIYDYYLTRFADRRIRFANAGVAGDSASGVQGRLSEDVIEKQPTSVAIMFGLNDMNRSLYVAAPDARILAERETALAGFRRNLEHTANRVRTEAGDPRLIFLTPSIFDHTMAGSPDNNQPGCNEGVGRCAEIVRAIAGMNHAPVVDFHGPMTAINAERQQRDPYDTIIGPDRVHPGPAGHLIMAWLFLQAQQVPSLVSRVSVDARSGQVTECANATVSHLAKQGDGWMFLLQEKALPFPVDAHAWNALTFLPIERDLNDERVVIGGLPSGRYALVIDGEVMGVYAASDLAEGIELACNTATPQYRQAQAVAALNAQRHATEKVLRNYAAVRWFLKHCQVNPDDAAAVDAFYQAAAYKDGYFEAQMPTYLENWPTRGVLLEQVAEFEQQLFALRQPVEHTYLIRPLP